MGLPGINALGLVLLPAFVAPGIGFALISAWPVAGFLGLELVLLYGTLRWNARGGRAREIIVIGETGAVVRQRTPWGRERTWTLPANWLGVAVRGHPGEDGGVGLRARAACILIGRWLVQDDRRHMADRLQAAILDVRRAPHRRSRHGDAAATDAARTVRYPSPGAPSMD